MNYTEARYRVEPVSKIVAKFVNFLHANNLSTLDETVIIGFSFGAHIAGLTAKKIVGGKVKTIVGLDPAGILFSKDKPDERIASTDA